MKGIDRAGMLLDVRAMVRRVWAAHNNSLCGEPLDFKNEAEWFERKLAFDVFAPDLRQYPLSAHVDSGSFRCGQCNRMQRGGTLVIYIPEHTMIGDPEWAILEQISRPMTSGRGWCVPCVRKLFKSGSGH